MKYFFVSLFLFVFASSSAQGQLKTDPNALGYHFDIAGNLIDDYLYHDYTPDDFYRFVIDPYRNYFKGEIGSSENAKKGYIRLSSKKPHIFFKDSLDGKKVKLEFKQIEYYKVLGEEYSTINAQIEKDELIASFGNWRFYDKSSVNHYFFDPTTNIGYGGGSKIRYLARNDSLGIEHLFVEGFLGNSRFKKELQEVFFDFPKTLDLLVEKNFKPTSFKTLVDLIELEYLNLNKSRGSVDFRFNLSRYPQTYSLNVDSIVQDRYYLSYYRLDSTLALRKEISFIKSTEYKTTDFQYDINGKLNAIYYFTAKRMDSMATYHDNGSRFERVIRRYGKNHYKMVYDSSGNEVLDEIGNGEVTHYDPINERQIVNIYQEHRLSTAFYRDPVRGQVFLLTEDPSDYKFFSKFTQSLTKSLKGAAIEDFKFEELQPGFLLFEALINSDGSVIDLGVKRSIDPVLDQFLLRIFEKQLSKKIEFTAAKYNKENVVQNVLIPVFISVFDPRSNPQN